MHLATRYKVISKLLFFASLMVAWAMVIVGVAKVRLTCMLCSEMPPR